MAIANLIKKLRTGDLVLHCTLVKVFQKSDNGIIMTGHGTIKINSVGTIYMEFICTASENIPSALFGESYPKDPLNDEDKLYLYAKTIDGSVYESNSFSISLNMNSHYPPVLHFIFLSSINSSNINEMYDVKKDSYLYCEFAEGFKIPANKATKIKSNNGSKSIKWDQTVLEMDNYSIHLVQKLGYTEVRISGDFEHEQLLRCLRFYIGFSSASMPQFLYILKRKGSEETEIISSINVEKKNQLASSPMIETASLDSHYQLLKNIINLYSERSEWFDSVYSQWERVWYSFQSENSIMALTLSVAIEGLLNDIYIPIIKDKGNNSELKSEICNIKKQIKEELKLTDRQRERLLNNVSHWGNITAANALIYLIDNHVVTTEDKKLWSKLRNESAHPKIKVKSFELDKLERDSVLSCLNLFHKLILNVLAYSGPVRFFKASKDHEHSSIQYQNVL